MALFNELFSGTRLMQPEERHQKRLEEQRQKQLEVQHLNDRILWLEKQISALEDKANLLDSLGKKKRISF